MLLGRNKGKTEAKKIKLANGVGVGAACGSATPCKIAPTPPPEYALRATDVLVSRKFCFLLVAVIVPVIQTPFPYVSTHIV